ncbi:translation initiation factor eIF2 beta subunit [Thermoplasma volcanium GSS1]|uniref:Putative methylthioribose-1-phosphate isomerase n=1 Tax=Thermoplasma volcanium (strain ATCC 51530 / DSM 4299 / JCM 9571 / NBRC 15438 / GSS1) TaxID=273116 RepID=Q978Y9_THEVO|nr:S-methyl-5-thioribose-1-phosphate isomerase [Thermoplasma volcanium]BAB60417.1 translation initiation factor eIF2 beta subunit [Thermoplasma volcanium GSS1]
MKVIIDGEVRTLKAAWYEDGEVKLIDQRELPDKIKIFSAKNSDDIAYAIKNMVVRGAPAIGVTAAYGLAMASKNGEDMNKAKEKIRATRPTAYDLFKAIRYMEVNGYDMNAARRYAMEIEGRSKKIGELGNELIRNGAKILTHCNAGALAVLDWGTALSPMRIAHNEGKNIFVFVDETRPRLQGAKLTAWELAQEGIDHAIIADNAAGFYMRRKEIDLVIVGADRIASNGDFANKIGTYEKAVLAKVNGIPFYVAAPGSTFDFSIRSGDEIPIEERDENEVLEINGIRIGPNESHSKNPAFDVTPNEYVTGFITEYGIFKPNELNKLKDLMDKDLFMNIK